MSNEAKSNLPSEETRRRSASTGAPCATRMVRKEDWERGLGEGTYCEGYRTIKGLSFRSAQEYSSLEEEEQGRRRRGQLRPRRKNRLSADVPYICPRQSRSAQPAANCTIAQAIHRKRIVAARVSPFPNTLYHVILPFFFFLSFSQAEMITRWNWLLLICLPIFVSCFTRAITKGKMKDQAKSIYKEAR